MACTRPLISKIVKISDFKKQVIVYDFSKYDYSYDYFNEKLTMLPCGKCESCALSYARTWANRITLEIKDYTYNYFLTLTYDEEHLPWGFKIPTLKKRDIQLFIKRLRKQSLNTIRYFGSGEYGTNFGRPHYHYLFFNLEINDLVVWGKNDLGQKYYVSKKINEIWGKGNVIIADVTWETASYVARYSLKKINSKPVHGREKEFITMSRRPGIGYNYYQKNKADIYNQDGIFVSSKKGTSKVLPPRYFDKLLEKEDDFFLKQIKNKRKLKFVASQKLEFKGTDKSNKSYLETKDDVLKNSLKKLKKTL